jgi:hypothetical protein
VRQRLVAPISGVSVALTVVGIALFIAFQLGARGAGGLPLPSVALPEVNTANPPADTRDVTAVVTDRVGVPKNLYDRYWFARDLEPSVAGQVGTTAQITLTSGEEAIAADKGMVASVTNGELLAAERESVIRIWDLRNGELIAKAVTSLYVEHAAFANGYLFWTGIDVNRAEPGQPALYPGGGLWAMAVGAGSEPTLVVPPEAKLAASAVSPYGQGTRAPLAVSASGATVVSSIYLDGGAVGRSDVVDVASLKVTATTGGFVCATTDETAIQCGADGTIAAVDLQSGKAVWTTSIGESAGSDQSSPPFIAAVLAVENRAYVEFSRTGDLIIAAVDLASGEFQDVLVQRGGASSAPFLFLAPTLSTTDDLVLLPDVGIGPSLERTEGKVSVSVFDTATSTLSADVFTLGKP